MLGSRLAFTCRRMAGSSILRKQRLALTASGKRRMQMATHIVIYEQLMELAALSASGASMMELGGCAARQGCLQPAVLR